MSDIYEKIKSSGNEFEQILREYNKERERKTQLIEGRQRRIDDIINTIMSDDYHYGTIPIGYDLTANDLQCIDVPLNLIITPQIVEYYDIGEFYTLEEFLELLALPDDYPIEIPSFMNLHSLFSLLQETKPFFEANRSASQYAHYLSALYYDEGGIKTTTEAVINNNEWRRLVLPDITLEPAPFSDLVLKRHEKYTMYSFCKTLGIDYSNYKKLAKGQPGFRIRDKQGYLFHLSLFFEMSLQEAVDFFYQCEDVAVLHHQNSILSNTLALLLESNVYDDWTYIELCICTFLFAKEALPRIIEKNKKWREAFDDIVATLAKEEKQTQKKKTRAEKEIKLKELEREMIENCQKIRNGGV